MIASGSHRKPKWGNEEGVALMMVLLFIVLLSAIVIEYGYETQVDASLMSNSRAEFEAYVAAKSAVASGMGALQLDLLQGQMAGTGTPSGGRGKAASQTGLQPDVDSLMDVWAEGVPRAPMNDAEMQGTVVDEFGKLNLNALVDSEGQPNELLVAALHALFEYLQVEEDPTEAIIDWVDPDQDTQTNGAESDYYEGLETPFSCRDGMMTSIEELLLIKGITPELYFDLNQDPAERQQRIADGERPASLSDLLTVHGHPQGFLNVNTAHPELLRGLADWAGIQPDALEQFLQNRIDQPAQTPEEAAEALQPSEESVKQAFTVSSNCFRIHGDGMSSRAMVRIEAFIGRAPSEALAQVGVGGGSSGKDQGLEVLRVLDWRVIR